MAKMIEISGIATTTEGSEALGAELEALINDGDDDILFGIDAPTTSSQRRTLKPGEQYSLQGYGVPCKTLFYKSASGDQAFRAWGLKN